MYMRGTYPSASPNSRSTGTQSRHSPSRRDARADRHGIHDAGTISLVTSPVSAVTSSTTAYQRSTFFEDRGRRLAVIGGRRFRVKRCGKAH